MRNLDGFKTWFKTSQVWAQVLAILFLLLLAAAGRAAAQTPAQAGIVVQSGDGSVATYCVSFTGDSISGYEALLATGLEVEAAFDPSLGAAVCGIAGEGCPANDCFCHYPEYWSYWHLNAGAWAYSGTGVSNYQLHAGDVDGWRWGAGDPPPVIPFGQICASAATETLPPPSSTVTPLPTKTATAPPPSPTALPPSVTPTETVSPTVTHAAPLPPPVQYIPSATPTPSETPAPGPTATPSVTATATGTATPSTTATPTKGVPSQEEIEAASTPSREMTSEETPTSVPSQEKSPWGALGLTLTAFGGALLWLSWRLYLAQWR